MPEPEWGAKHICPSCGVKFYDLHRKPITCPTCDTMVVIETAQRSRRSPPPPARRPPPPAVVAAAEAEAPDDTDEQTGDEEGSALIEDASDLGEDETDVAEVLNGAKPTTPAS